MKRQCALFLIWTVFSVVLFAQPKPGYYDSAVGKSEAALKTALYNIVKGHTQLSYTPGLWDAYETTDINPETGKIWDMYSTCAWVYETKQCGNYKVVCDCYNREHSIPQSWFNEKSPMKSDAFHVYPTDGKVNGQRSNYPYGECSNGVSESGKSLGRLGTSTFPGYSGIVFEPVDEYKGDFARTYFYFATRYEDIMTSIGGESFNKTVYPSFSTWSLNLFLKWHRQDPVSQKETDRNNAVEKLQKNRNPFIDYPELVEYIWGNKKGEAWSLTTGLDEVKIDFTILQNPVQDKILIQVREQDLAYSIFNLSGQTVKSGSLDGDEINAAELQDGLYLLQLQAGDRKTIQKFIVNK